MTDYVPWNELPAEEQRYIAPYCPGGFISQTLPVVETGETYFTFNRAQTGEDNSASFSGDVAVKSNNFSANADEVSYGTSGQTALDGDVTIRLPDISISSSSAIVNAANNTAELTESEFVLPRQDIHGKASILEQQSEQFYTAENIAFTRCAPVNPAWQIKASRLSIDNEEQVARAWHSRIEVKDIPVLYVPYISFPLNNQARTGFLIPTFGSGYFQEYYLHLAPNYDDTLALNYVSGSGLYGQNQFRFLTQRHNGENNFSFKLADISGEQSELESSTDAELSRWSVQHQQSGLLTDNIGYDLNTRWVSDPEFDVDITPGSTTLINNQVVNLKFNAKPLGTSSTLGFVYREPVPYSTERLNTLDSTLTLKRDSWTASALYQTQTDANNGDTPLAASGFELIKVPELKLSHTSTWPGQIKTSENLQYAQFSRELPGTVPADLTLADAELDTVSHRTHASLLASRSFKTDWSSTIPTLQGLATGYQYDNDLDAALAEEDFQHLAWRASLDQRFTLTAGEGNSKHQLSPRFYYAYAPLTEQQAPVLNTEAESSFTLFSNSRFSGVDRVGDMSRLSTSLTYNYLVNNQSFFKLGVDKGVKLQQERLTLTDTNDIDPDWEPEFSDWKFSGELNLTEELSFKGSAALDHEALEYNSFSSEVNYSPSENVFVNLQATKDDDGHSIRAGTYYPLLQNVAFIGYANYETDVDQPQWQDYRTKELLFGLDIDSCCWNLRFALLETAAAEDEDGNSIFLENSQIAPYFEFTLKGIGAGTGTIEDMLKRLDFGYTGRLFNYR